MGIFGRVPSGGGPGTSRRDRRQSGAKARSKTVARRETERKAQVFIVAGIIVVALAVIGVAGFGYYQTTVKPKQETVLKVGDRSFSMGYVEKRLRYEIRNATPGEPLLLNQDIAVVETLNKLEAEELNRIGAPTLNISVSGDEVEAKIRQNLGLSDSSDPATYADAYRRVVRDSGLSPSEYREVIGAQLLEDKIRQNLRESIPATAEQIKLRDIRVKTEAEANAALTRLTAGEDFAAIAGELSLDTNTKTKGGEMDWMPRAALEPETGDAVFVLDVGQRTQPIWSSATQTFYIYEVMEKSPSMEVTESQRTIIENQSYTNWQNNLNGQTTITRNYLDKPIVDAQGTLIGTDMINHLKQVAANEGSGVDQAGQ
jgi:SurA-like N-terminal domain/PPIC-type PPIASE domain